MRIAGYRGRGEDGGHRGVEGEGGRLREIDGGKSEIRGYR